jgi:hypothetical protein
VLADTRARQLVRCEEGVDQHLADFVVAPPDLRDAG